MMIALRFIGVYLILKNLTKGCKIFNYAHGVTKLRMYLSFIWESGDIYRWFSRSRQLGGLVLVTCNDECFKSPC